MGDERNLLLRIAVDLQEHAPGPFGHDHDTRRHVDQFAEDAALVGVGFLQHGVQGGDDRHARAPQKPEQVAAGRTAEDAEFMLHAKRVDVGEIEKVGRADIRSHVRLGDLETNIIRIAVIARTVRHGDDRATPVRIGLRHRIAQIARESGNTALPRRVVPEESHFADGRRGGHAPHSFSPRGVAYG